MAVSIKLSINYDPICEVAACRHRETLAYLLIFDIQLNCLKLFFFSSSLNCQDVSNGISLRAIDDIWLLLLHTNGHFGWRTLAVLRSTTVNTPDDNQNELDKKERSASEKETYFLQNNIMKNRDKKFI